MKFKCWATGHDKKYLAMRRNKESVKCNDMACCSKTTHDILATTARWICSRCDAMGEDRMLFGAYKIEFGKLLPDEKEWANFA